MALIFSYKADKPPFSHQRSYIEEHGMDAGYALWWEQGTGKSKGLIDTTDLLFCERAIDGLFLLAPNGLHRNFITKQIPEHMPEDIAEQARCLFWHTAKSKTQRWMNEARDWMAHKGLKVLGMSYDGLMTDIGRKLAGEYLTSTRCLYGVDESGRIKDVKAARTERVLKSSKFAPFKRIMTGTPVANAPWDTYSQIKFIDDDFWKPHGLDSPEAMKAAFALWERGARRVPIAQAKWPKSGKLKVFKYPPGFPESQKSSYVIQEGTALLQFPKQVINEEGRPQYKNLDRLRSILHPIRSRVLKENVFDLPPKIYSPLEFELTAKQRAAYESMLRLGFAMVDDRSCSPGLALTVLLRLQQIACGYLVTDAQEGEEDPVVLAIDPNPRLDLMLEVTEDLDHQAIIWARFTPDVDAIMAGLAKQGKRAVRYDGLVDDDQCEENENAFHRGDAQFFVSKASKGGEGLTLNEAKTHIYYSNTFKLTERLQSEDRSHRYGQDTRVNYIDLIARGTVDERIVSALQGKMDVAGAVTGDGLKTWLQRDGKLF